ncbi:MAG: hypothetical protein AAF677_18100 [Pseudomonadota bacterium]
MPHDRPGAPDQGPDHDHDHGQGHDQGHSRAQGRTRGHNRAADHLLSHLGGRHTGGEQEADLQALAAAFIDGFVQAEDKISFLRVAGVPFERACEHGGPALKLVDVRLATEWQVGTASPAFGTRELSYRPLTGAMVAERTNLTLVYVSLDRRLDLDLRTFLAAGHGDP